MRGLPYVFLAIEAGGSTGRAAIAWEGKIAARYVPAGLNPNDVDRGLLKRRLEALIVPLLDLPEEKPKAVRAYAAFAGAGSPRAREICRSTLRAVLEPRSSKLDLKVTSDAEAMLECFFARRDGIVLIAGTGSICLGIRHARHGRVTARAGGWGSQLDRGCGFRLGSGVLDAALRAIDGTGQITAAVDLVCRRYHLALDEVPRYFLPVGRNTLADLAPIALEASALGDRTARRSVTAAARDLAEMALAVSGRIGLKGGFDLVISGGLFKHRAFRNTFRRILKRKLPSARIYAASDPLARIVGLQRPI
jgi:N-acetylglucosamine kinase-like BadF-type ATPase